MLDWTQLLRDIFVSGINFYKFLYLCLQIMLILTKKGTNPYNARSKSKSKFIFK